jgi:hypothetical protein
MTRLAARTWTAAEVLALGVRCDVETAGSIFGLSRTQAYEAVKAGRFPVSVIRVGRHLIVPIAPIRRLLDMEAAGPAPPDPAGHSAAAPIPPKDRRHDNDNPSRRRCA